MKTRLLAGTVAAMLPLIGLAQNTVSHSCTLGEITRRVEIFSEPGRAVPCEVHYYKDTEAPGERQVLWSASSQAGYCEQKTEEFIARLESWGWDCSAGGTAAGAPPSREGGVTTDAMPGDDAAPAETDDTGDLAPADEASAEQE